MKVSVSILQYSKQLLSFNASHPKVEMPLGIGS